MLQALRLEMHYSKQELLEAYLNLAPYGGNIEGVGAASRIYFERDASTLSLPEALTLAVIPQSPVARTPGRSAASNTALQQARLRVFGEWIVNKPEDARYEPLLKHAMHYSSKKDLPFIAPQAVSRLLREQKDNVITATLDAKLQQQLAGAVQRYVLHSSGFANAAALLVDTRDMGVLASVGSADYFNIARQGMIDGTMARRSPGSALKPFIYALAFDQGIIHPASLMTDAPTAYGTYAPENYDRAFEGPLSASDALVRSRNIPALWLTSQLSKPSFYNFLQNVGINRMKPEKTYGLSLALGGVEVTMRELVQLYAMLANDGVYNQLRESRAQPAVQGKQFLSPEAAFITLDILQHTAPPGGSVMADTLPLPVYWKTGTSAGLRDAWSAGVFGHYALAVWVGDFRGSTHGSYVGITHAAPLFFDIVKLVAASEKPKDILQAKASGLHLATVKACADTGDIDSPYCLAKIKAIIIPGVSPIKPSGIYRNVLVNRNTGKLACKFVPEVTDYRVMQFWPSEIADVYADAGIKKPSMPQWDAGCNNALQSETNLPRITSPARNTHYTVRQNADNRLPLKAVLGANVHMVYWFINNTPVATARPDETVFVPLQAGKHVVKVVDDAGHAATQVMLVE
jgi:penicillin-binding protein 1C